MTVLCAVDTGVKYHAQAWFDGTTLHAARLVKDCEPICVRDALWECDRLIIECATVRKQDGHTKKREVDALNRAAGRLGALHPTPEFWLPEQWKSQVPKAIDHKRTLALLNETELLVLKGMKAGELKHVMDAIGIGLRAVGRK